MARRSSERRVGLKERRSWHWTRPRMTASWTRRLPVHGHLTDEDRRAPGLGWVGSGSEPRAEQDQDTPQRQAHPSRTWVIRPLGSRGLPAQCSGKLERRLGAAAPRGTRTTRSSTSTSIRALSGNWPRTMASASGSSMCFWIVRRSCRAP